VEAFLEEFCVTPRKYFDQIDATVQMLDWIPDKVLRPAQPRIIGLRTNYNGTALGRGRRVPRVIGGKWRI